MNKIQVLKSAAIASLLTMSTSGFGQPLSIDPQTSSIGFKIKHMLVATLDGSFKDFSGTIDKDETNFLNSKVSFVVKTNSIDTDNTKRDEHLRTADFFDVKKFPEATFTSTKIEANGDKKFILHGDLRIRDQVKKVKFDLIEKSAGTMNAYEASIELNRLDYAVGESSLMIGDAVQLTIHLQEPAH